jgi:hypothetical protein
VCAAASGWASFVFWTHHSFAIGPAIVNALLWLIPAYLFALAARTLITIFRFRLEIDPDAVSYRGMFRESTYPRAKMGVLRWTPGLTTRTPPYVAFKDLRGDVLFSVLGSLLSAAQLQEISSAMHRSIEDLPAQ